MPGCVPQQGCKGGQVFRIQRRKRSRSLGNAVRILRDAARELIGHTEPFDEYSGDGVADQRPEDPDQGGKHRIIQPCVSDHQ